MPGEYPGPLRGLTGKGVRIAIIDSGVHVGHDHILADRIADGVAIARDGDIDQGVDAAMDLLGHGTAVTAAIQEKAPDALCLPIRVFHSSLKTTGLALVRAIEWALDQRVDIINLSLGSANAAHRDAFMQAVQRARSVGAAIVAAHDVDGAPCLPGAIKGVIGVGLDWNCPRATYGLSTDGESTDGGHFMASGYPRPIPGVPPRRNLYGISFATAQMSGFAARALEAMDDAATGPARVDALRAKLIAALSR